MTDSPARPPDRPGLRVRTPGWFLLVLVAALSSAGYAIYWLIRSARF